MKLQNLMIIRKASKYRLKVNENNIQAFAKAGGCCRLVWNKALDLQKKSLDRELGRLFYSGFCKHLSELKKEEDLYFLKEAHSQPLQQTLKDLDRALSDFFVHKKGFPHFKKKGEGDSFRYPQGCKIEGNRLFLPKIGWISFFHSTKIVGEIKNVTISNRGKHWYASVQTEYEVNQPHHPSSSIVGIDMGICRFATLSDEDFYEPLNSFKKLEKKLVLSQKRLSRKTKFSNNWKKQKRQLAQVHIQIANARQDYLHKVSTQISKNHAVIVLEDLKIKDMSASAKGNIDHPGQNVKKKSGLNKAILDQGWFEFRRQLEYKQLWRGGKIIIIPPQYTSQTCPKCTYISSNNRLSQAVFKCIKCAYQEHADVVAAKNILAVGQTVLACESNLNGGRKQELAELREESLLLV